MVEHGVTRSHGGRLVPSPVDVVLCALAALVVWTATGLPLAWRLMPGRALALAAAPALGWAVFCPLAFLVLLAAGFTRWHVALLLGAGVVGGLVALAAGRAARQEDGPAFPWWALLLAALVALAPALAVMPKVAGDGVRLAPIIFDHTKVAMIDEMVRQGLPPGNAFFGEAGTRPLFAYYYLWHFGAACFALLLGTSGWAADAACSWATAAASLLLMMGLAVEVSGRRRAAAWVAVIALTSSLRPLIQLVFGAHALDALLSPDAQLQTWVVQASWAPQHLASATSLVLAVLLLVRLTRDGGWLASAVLALVVSAAFEASAWIGGVTFAAAAGPLALALLVMAEPGRRWSFLAKAASAAIVALVVASPFIRDEALVTAARDAGAPIALAAYPVLGPILPEAWRRLLDLPAYWLVLLVVEFPAFFLAGTVVVLRGATGFPPNSHSSHSVPSDRHSCESGNPPAAGMDPRLRGDDGRRRDDGKQETVMWRALGLVALSGLVVGWLVASTIANNDLGWRAGLPAVLVLTAFAAAGLARWRGWAAGAAILMVLLGLPGGILFMRDNFLGTPATSAALFAETPELWAAVRRHAAPDQRVGNNPLAFADVTSWPIDASWALLADRPSCYAGWALARAFVALPPAEIDRIDALFTRVFAGTGSAEDVHELATRYACHVVVVTVEDGAWQRDPFVQSADYRLVETKADRWRIYEATGG